MTRVLVEDVERAQDAQQVPASAEQAADFAALRAAADEQAAALAPVEPAGPDLAAEISDALGIVVGILGAPLPSLRAIYTDEVRAAVGASVAAVCNKHGWMQGGLMGQWGEEIACAAVVLPLGWATYNGVKADVERIKAAAENGRPAGRDAAPAGPAPGAPREPGQRTVTFGAAVPATP